MPRKRRRTRQLPGWRRWGFRAAAVLLTPLLLFGSLEGVLRAVGYGYPASFFVELEEGASSTTNQRFGWRFFPRSVARTPVVALVPRKKAPETYRIFVLGGSAAMGTPDAAFSFGRILEVMLQELYPEVEFEVINAAMAAINSHVVLEIARECAHHEPDLFLVYLGNNEVVGPYGPGTVFHDFSPSLQLIRLGIRARSLKTGQLLDSFLSRLRRRSALAEWKGMEMFLERQIAADAPKMNTVYAHFQRNLEDLLTVAAGANAQVVISTVVTNLKDSPPFASVHRDDRTADEIARWQASLARGVEHLKDSRPAEAVAVFREAMDLDDGVAELHFRLAQAYLELERIEETRSHFRHARDLDALRFRADTRINEIIRQTASAKTSSGVAWVDAERALGDVAAVPGLPGEDLFYEHAHLNFRGNYLLARLFLENLEASLPEGIRRSRTSPVAPSMERCAALLSLTDWDRARMAETILELTKRPPFANQAEHAERIARRRRHLGELRARARAGLDRAQTSYEHALRQRPDDLLMRKNFALLLHQRRRYDGAAQEWRTLVESVPAIASWHTQLAFALADGGRLAEAKDELQLVLHLFPHSAQAHVNLGTVVEAEGDLARAAEHHRRALGISPSFEPARFNLGSLLEKQGELEKAAEEYREVLRRDPHSAEAHSRLGGVLEQQGRIEEAIREYQEALRLDPDLVKAHNNLGVALERQGRLDEAAEEYRRALEVDPEFGLAYFNLGDVLLTQGRAQEAAESYRSGLRIRPKNVQAHYNLALALMVVGELRAAASELRWVLAEEPDRAEALQNLTWLERRLAGDADKQETSQSTQR